MLTRLHSFLTPLLAQICATTSEPWCTRPCLSLRAVRSYALRRPRTTSKRWPKSALWIFRCSPVIDAVSSLRIIDTFAFGAPKVIGHFVAIWMISYGDKVIIRGMRSKACISSLLYSSHIGHHTSILFLNNRKRKGDTISVARYIWGHDTQRPNTHTFPIACPSCHTLHPWNRPNSASVANGVPITLNCTSFDSSCVHRCNETYVIDSRPPSTALASPYVGTWFSCT